MTWRERKLIKKYASVQFDVRGRERLCSRVGWPSFRNRVVRRAAPPRLASELNLKSEVARLISEPASQRLMGGALHTKGTACAKPTRWGSVWCVFKEQVTKEERARGEEEGWGQERRAAGPCRPCGGKRVTFFLLHFASYIVYSFV